MPFFKADIGMPFLRTISYEVNRAGRHFSKYTRFHTVSLLIRWARLRSAL